MTQLSSNLRRALTALQHLTEALRAEVAVQEHGVLDAQPLGLPLTAHGRAVELLREVVLQGTAVAAGVVIDAAIRRQINLKTLQRARVTLGLVTKKVAGSWYWYWPMSLEQEAAIKNGQAPKLKRVVNLAAVEKMILSPEDEEAIFADLDEQEAGRLS